MGLENDPGPRSGYRGSDLVQWHISDLRRCPLSCRCQRHSGHRRRYQSPSGCRFTTRVRLRIMNQFPALGASTTSGCSFHGGSCVDDPNSYCLAVAAVRLSVPCWGHPTRRKGPRRRRPTELRASAAPGRCRSPRDPRENSSQERRGMREPRPASANPDSIRFL